MGFAVSLAQAALERKHRVAITELGVCKQRLEDVKASVTRQGLGSEDLSRMCAKAEVSGAFKSLCSRRACGACAGG